MAELNKRVLARLQRDLDGFVARYHKLLEVREAKYFKEIAPVWRRAEQRLDKAVKALYTNYSDGQGKLSDKKLQTLRHKIDGQEALKHQIAAALDPVTKPLQQQIGNILAYEYSRSYYFNAFGLEQAGQIEVKVPAVSPEQVMGVIKNPWLGDGATYSDRLRNNTAYLAEKMYQAIGKATVEGWDVNTAARYVQRTAQEGYFNSVRLVRTELTRAAAQGATQLYMENADVLDGKRWVATLDGRTAARDARNDGKIYPLEYDTSEMPGRVGERIPNHPHCRCRWTPVLSALGVSTRQRIARGKGDSVDNFGERVYTKARNYEEYAKERKLPTLDDRLAQDNPRQYLRRGEKLAADTGPLVGVKPTQAAQAPLPVGYTVEKAFTFVGDSKNPIVRDAHVYTTPDGVRIVQPADLDTSKQRYTAQQVADGLQKLPPELRKHVKQVQLVDYRNPFDDYWGRQYGIKDFRSAATGSNGNISFYENGHKAAEEAANALVPHLAHEAGHSFDQALCITKQVVSKSGRYSESRGWKALQTKDYKARGVKWTSSYARQSKALLEDFADACKGIVIDPAGFKMSYPNRYEFLRKELKLP